MGTFRATRILIQFAILTLPLMPVQAILVRVSPSAARRFPHWYHRKVCQLLGLTLNIEGQVAAGQPVLLVCNHTSWLDIPVLSAVAPLSFIAKKEVSGWPFVASLARLQQTVFIDRNRRQSAGEATHDIVRKLLRGDTVVLFAEGTSSDGNRVLPFKTSLFGVAEHLNGQAQGADVAVQTAAIVYTHVHGLPLGRAGRPKVGWYGDMEMLSHAWQVLKSGPLKATVVVGPPQPVANYKDRKDMALATEREIRNAVIAIQRHKFGDEQPIPVEPGAEARRTATVTRARSGEKWT